MEWKICAFSVFWKVLLRDPLDDNVIPIVEELQRRLPPVNAVCEGQVSITEQKTMLNLVNKVTHC